MYFISCDMSNKLSLDTMSQEACVRLIRSLLQHTGEAVTVLALGWRRREVEMVCKNFAKNDFFKEELNNTSSTSAAVCMLVNPAAKQKEDHVVFTLFDFGSHVIGAGE